MNKRKLKSHKIFNFVSIGIGLSLVYWIFVSLKDAFEFQKSNFIEQLFILDTVSLLMRFIPVCIIILLSIFAQNMINKCNRAKESLQKGYNELEKKMERQTLELSIWNKLLKEELNEQKLTEEQPQKQHDLLRKLVGKRTVILKEVNRKLLQEINERKKAEKALQINEIFMLNMIEKNADAIVIVDKQGIIQFVNPAAEVLFWRTKEELLNTDFGFPMVVGDSTEMDIIGEDGEARVAEMRAAEMEWDEKNVYLVSIRDITERKKAEEAIREANKRLRKLDRLKSDFISTVSHELRTPISIIQESIDLCLDGAGGELIDSHKKFLMSADRNINRLARLVTDLLDISKIESGKLRFRRSLTNLWDIGQKIYESYSSNAKNKGIDLELKKGFSGKSCILYVDEDKVYQIFNNLLSNAFRYTKSGGKITIELEDRENMVEFSVSDTGIGIKKQNIPKLFSKFEQIGRIDGPGYKGTGLGLAICKGLVEKHGGKIWVESELGKGSIFRFTLKKVPFPKILIVDDEKDMVEMIKTRLTINNFRVAEAYDGKTAIEMARNEDISLIVLDVHLPKMSGYEVIGRLKQYKSTQNIPIIVMSAFQVDSEKLVQINLNSVIPVFNKPFDPDEFKEKIEELLID